MIKSSILYAIAASVRPDSCAPTPAPKRGRKDLQQGKMPLTAIV